MNRDEKYIARLMFKLKVYESNGQAYEDLFVKIMQYDNNKFESIKPQGQFGDRKNDGFDKTIGKYYQVYAPEDLQKSQSNSIEKLNTDFDGLYKHWNHLHKINEFFYVLNDKYKGTFPTLHEELSKLSNKYENISFSTFLPKDLEDIFLNLDEDKIMSIIGGIPNVDSINNMDYKILNEVVKHLMNYKTSYTPPITPENPDFNKKIEFNNLSKYTGSLLTLANYQSYILDEYFSSNSEFTKNELRDIFNSLYQEALKSIEEQENKSDLVFFYILDKASPSSEKALKDSVLVLMSYYFEYCDIFEAPQE
jgi:hypothetical protein